jgi:hypothetical protein
MLNENNSLSHTTTCNLQLVTCNFFPTFGHESYDR